MLGQIFQSHKRSWLSAQARLQKSALSGTLIQQPVSRAADLRSQADRLSPPALFKAISNFHARAQFALVGGYTASLTLQRPNLLLCEEDREKRWFLPICIDCKRHMPMLGQLCA
jgi:hypothetical protein